MAIDKTDAGPQHVLPGAERASLAELAKRQAAAPMKPAKRQAACDHGLFADDGDQLDLVDLVRRGR